MAYVLVLYYSWHQSTAEMAKWVARGIDQTGLMESRLRTVPRLPHYPESSTEIEEGPVPFVTLDDLSGASGLAVGSPGHFGNMAAPLTNFIASTSGLWLSGALKDKPFSVFASTASLHGGQETTLMSMALPWLHHGMVFVGIPYTQQELLTTQQGGTPYGATHVTGQNQNPLSQEEQRLCVAMGQRLGQMADRLKD